MKKIFTITLLFAAVMMSAQEVPTSFPRKFVIEHFTGDQCGYCPGGMYSITDYILEEDSSAIWVSHNYGYNTDEYTISESKKIGTMLGVSGAPNMALNRTKVSGNAIAFHPGNLTATVADKCEREALASVVIEHSYNAETRTMDITVSGQVAEGGEESYLLTVLVKENRLVGKQADYNYSWKTGTWKEYMHARVARGFVTPQFGDTVVVENQAYSKSFTYTLDEEWIAESCCVVAFLTPLSKKPIVNAEQAAVVEGTMGGEQYYPYGITEGSAPNKTVEADSIVVTKLDNGQLEVQLIADKSIKTASGSAKAVALIYLNTDKAELVPGTYPVAADLADGTLEAGYRIDEERDFGGSRLIYALSSTLKKGIITPCHTWRMAEGEMIVRDNENIEFEMTTYSGAKVTITYTVSDVAVDNVISPEMQAQKIIQNGRLVILKNGIEYDVLGNTLQ
jgi:hypothetical protein